jgi:hypothetical protein
VQSWFQKTSPMDKWKSKGMCADIFGCIDSNENFFKHVITGDKSWILEYDPETKLQSSEWHMINSARPQKARMSKLKIKSTLICFFNSQSVVYKQFMPRRQTANSTVIRSLSNSEKEFISSHKLQTFGMLHHDTLPVTLLSL